MRTDGFVKPLVPKLFRAAVWPERRGLEREAHGLAPSTPVVASEPVTITAEARSFVLDGTIVSTAIDEGAGDVTAASELAAAFAAVIPLPRTCVLDTCCIAGRGWAFLEANATWGAGLNGCDPEAVVPGIGAATVLGGERA